jgi:hypothetical protein
VASTERTHFREAAKCISLSLAEQGPEAEDENDSAQNRGSEACEQNSAGGDIETISDTRFRYFVETLENGLNGAIEKLGGQDQADTPEQNAPLERFAAQCQSSREDQGGQEEMNEETGMPANSKLDPAKGVSEFVPPGAAGPSGWGKPGLS